MASLSISNVSKTYGDSVALYPTSLEVADGEFCCMLGSSGSGKSTLLRMISGLTEPDEGTIRVSGKDVTHVAVNKRSIGFVFQNYALFPHLSVSSNVAFGLARKGLGRARVAAKVQEMLTLVGLGGYGDRAPKDLSGGQQQRVALARALVTEPDLLLLDEPLSALDKKIRGEMQRELKRIHRETGLTTVMVTHDQEEAMDLGDQVLLLDGGRVQQHGDPHVLYREPHNRFVAEFLGAYLLGSGSLTARGAEHAVRVGSVTLPLDAPHAGAGAGASVDVAVRSEEVAVRPWTSSSATPAASDLDGTLTAIDFFGPFARAVVSVGDLSLTSTMLSQAAEPLVVGGRVHVRVNPQGVHVFDQA